MMRQTPNKHIYQYRKRSHLLLKDVAYLLNMDEGNLSRFEAGKSQNPKALLGYHAIFNLSIDQPLFPLIHQHNNKIVQRAHELLKQLETKSKTKKNQLRIRGVQAIIRKLTPQTDHEGQGAS